MDSDGDCVSYRVHLLTKVCFPESVKPWIAEYIVSEGHSCRTLPYTLRQPGYHLASSYSFTFQATHHRVLIRYLLQHTQWLPDGIVSIQPIHPHLVAVS